MFSFILFHFQLFHSLINFLFGSMHAVTITLATRQILSAPYIFRWCGICTVHVVAAVTYTGRWCWRWCCVLQCYWSSCRHSFPHQTAASGRSSIPADPEPASPPSRDRSPNIRKKQPCDWDFICSKGAIMAGCLFWRLMSRTAGIEQRFVTIDPLQCNTGNSRLIPFISTGSSLSCSYYYEFTRRLAAEMNLHDVHKTSGDSHRIYAR